MSTDSGQLVVYNAIMDYLDVGPDTMKGFMVVEDYDFGGWKDDQYGVPAPGELGMTFRLVVPKDSEQSNPEPRYNGFLAPETSAGGMATGMAVHRGEQQKACDTVRLIRRSPNALAA